MNFTASLLPLDDFLDITLEAYGGEIIVPIDEFREVERRIINKDLPKGEAVIDYVLDCQDESAPLNEEVFLICLYLRMMDSDTNYEVTYSKEKAERLRQIYVLSFSEIDANKSCRLRKK